MARTVWMSLAAISLLTSACAPGDVEFNGKIFEAAGLSTSSFEKAKTPKVAERAPLVLPPSLERLPAPGSDAASAEASLPINPEERRVASASNLQKAQAAYCKENYEKPLALGDSTRAATAKGPLGLCAPSALQSLTGTNPLIQR